MAKSGIWFFRTFVKTRVNTARYRIGLSMDQAAPRTEDLYLTLMSFRTRFDRISLAWKSSRRREAGWSRGGSEVRTMASLAVGRSGPFVRVQEHAWGL